MTLPVTPGQEPTMPAAPVTPPTPAVAPEPEDELVKLIKADPNRTAEEIRALRHEAAENRKKATEAETKRQAEEAKKLEEQGKFKELAEKREAELAELRASLKEDKIKSAVLLEATKAGVVDPEAAYVLADLSKTDLSEAGAVTGAAEAVAALVKAKPYLINKEPGKGAPPIGASNPAGGPAMTVTDIRKMSASEIAALSVDDYNALMAGLKQN